MEYGPTFEQSKPPQDNERKSGFFKRWQKKNREPVKEPPVQTPEAPERVSKVRQFAHNVVGLLRRREQPTPPGRPEFTLPPPIPAETLQPPTVEKIAKARSWGKRVLGLVATTTDKVRRQKPGPTRTENIGTLTDAQEDMSEALYELDDAATPPEKEQVPTAAAPERSVSDMNVAERVQYEVRRSIDRLHRERDRLRSAESPSQTNRAMTLGVLALFGGGLLLAAIDERRDAKKRLIKQEKIIQNQTEQLTTLEKKVEDLERPPERELVRRIGEFTHRQAQLTRDIAQEVREERTVATTARSAEVPSALATFQIPKEATVFRPPTEHIVPTVGERVAKIEASAAQEKSESPTAQKSRSSAAGGASAGLGGVVAPVVSAAQHIAKQIKPLVTTAKKQQLPKDPVAGYAVVFLAAVAALVIGLLVVR